MFVLWRHRHELRVIDTKMILLLYAVGIYKFFMIEYYHILYNTSAFWRIEIVRNQIMMDIAFNKHLLRHMRIKHMRYCGIFKDVTQWICMES